MRREFVMPHTVLLLQDNAADATAIRRALSESSDQFFQIESVRSLSEGLSWLAGKSPVSAIVLDLFLPDSSGIETFDKLLLAARQIPILVLTNSHGEALAKLAVQRGAQDYLLKERLDSYLLPKTLDSMIERAANAEALFDEKERAQVTLNSIGDAVVSTDVEGHVTYLNVVAEAMTGWPLQQAKGLPLETVFRIIDGTTRAAVKNPMKLAILENKTVGLTPNCILLRRDGVEAAIEDSAAPIHDRQGRVTGAVMVFHDVTAARALSVRLSHLAEHDSLTGLPNRLLLNDRLTQAIVLAERHRKQLAVLFLDIDRFKHINDSMGHAVGDRLLQSVAERLVACVRSSDTVSRQGGDEFIILLSELTDAQDAAASAEKILLALAKPYCIDEHDLYMTASIGIVAYPDDGADADTLVKNADVAMYHAKNSGRGNYQFFKPEMHTRAIERHSIESGLRAAIERHELVLLYQPRVTLETGTTVGVEALVRWHHPKRGLLCPAKFIPIAEECGIIDRVGHWVLREACRQAKAWQDAGLPPMRIAVNMSAVEMRAKGFVAGVRAILAETGLAPRFLELELTESLLMQDSHFTAGILRALKGMGVHLALDDFGTGYSSLSYLKRFPIDTLKIDQSFVRDITTDNDAASIVSAIISMGDSLHLRVVAEGVETREQLVFLQEHGCHEGQGFYFSPPVIARSIHAQIAAANFSESCPAPFRQSQLRQLQPTLES